MRLSGGGSCWVLGAAIVAGLALRLWGLDFGLPHTAARPDESVLVHRALDIAGGHWNPHFFNYPSFHLYLLSGVFGLYYLASLLVGTVDGTQAFLLRFLLDPSGLYLTGRWLTALMGTATIACCWHMGRTLGGRAAATASAILIALAFLHVRDSHFLTVDVPATFWVTASLAVLVDHAHRGGRRRLVIGAILAGLAMSTKYNAVLFLPAMALAVWRSPGGDRLRDPPLALAIAAAAFLCGSPFIALDPGGFWRDFLFEWQHFGRGHAGQELGNGWLYHLTFTLRHGLGLPLVLGAVSSLVWLARRRRPGDLVLLTAVLGYFAVAGSGGSLFVRYAIPLVPLLSVAAGTGLARLAQERMAIVTVASLALVAPSAVVAVQHDRLLARQDTRELARRWIERQVPSGARIALTGSSYGHPRLHPTRSWLQRRWEDVRNLGETGRRLRLSLDLSAYPPDPAYDLVELRAAPHPGLRSVRAMTRVADLRAAGIEWLVTQSHPLAYSAKSQDLARDLASLAPVVEFSPAPPEVLEMAAFDPLDAYFLPYAGHRGMWRPGPHLRVYRIDGRAAWRSNQNGLASGCTRLSGWLMAGDRPIQ